MFEAGLKGGAVCQTLLFPFDEFINGFSLFPVSELPGIRFDGPLVLTHALDLYVNHPAADFELTNLSLQLDYLRFQVPSLDDSTLPIHDYIADPDSK